MNTYLSQSPNDILSDRFFSQYVRQTISFRHGQRRMAVDSEYYYYK
jgi:hypothetical protein